MWKQQVILEDESNFSALNRYVGAFPRIKIDVFIQFDPSSIWRDNACNRPQNGRFTGSGGAKENRDALSNNKTGIQRKGNPTVRFELFVDLGAEHQITHSLAVASVHW